MDTDDRLSAWREGKLARSPEETEALAAEFAKILPPDTALAMHGDLGVGKTTFVRGFARALGIREPVTSPTYAIFCLYKGAPRRLRPWDGSARTRRRVHGSRPDRSAGHG